MEYKDAKVVMLPTNNESKLILDGTRLVFCKESRRAVIKGAYNQHLYIISDEEINGVIGF